VLVGVDKARENENSIIGSDGSSRGSTGGILAWLKNGAADIADDFEAAGPDGGVISPRPNTAALTSPQPTVAENGHRENGHIPHSAQRGRRRNLGRTIISKHYAHRGMMQQHAHAHAHAGNPHRRDHSKDAISPPAYLAPEKGAARSATRTGPGHTHTHTGGEEYGQSGLTYAQLRRMDKVQTKEHEMEKKTSTTARADDASSNDDEERADKEIAAATDTALAAGALGLAKGMSASKKDEFRMFVPCLHGTSIPCKAEVNPFAPDHLTEKRMGHLKRDHFVPMSDPNDPETFEDSKEGQALLKADPLHLMPPRGSDVADDDKQETDDDGIPMPAVFGKSDAGDGGGDNDIGDLPPAGMHQQQANALRGSRLDQLLQVLPVSLLYVCCRYLSYMYGTRVDQLLQVLPVSLLYVCCRYLICMLQVSL
jgi:hypothetical protein